MAQYSKEQLRSIFQNRFNQEAWKSIVVNIFGAGQVRRVYEKFTSDEDLEEGYFLGSIDTPDNYRIGLFYYKINSGSVAHKKVGFRNLLKKWVNPNWGEFDAAIVVFNDGEEWRLSFICDIKEDATAPKRFTYVFGEKDNFYKTPVDRLENLQTEEPTFANIRKTFSVDALSDDFFDDYRELYADFVEYITGKRYVKSGSKWEEKVITRPNHQFITTFDSNDKLVRDYIKKMFGRIVFLYFLQRKGWLNGNKQYMHDLFYNSDKKDDFLDGVLEPLFFEVLNEEKPYRTKDAKSLPGCENIPYLNGGLFARDEIDERTCIFPADYFKRLFDFLDSYNFTIDENDTDDAEIGIDPEMLGRIFENLLEDNKDKGAFYTPKEIVQYMCRESLIAYLIGELQEIKEEKLRLLVEKLDTTDLSDKDKLDIRKTLQKVKICDPAIGSGAFPMGLVNLLSKLYVAMKSDTDTAKMKRHIMEQNIYGVDLEKGAVDIARLRFWLAMIVEEKEPIPLPNLHFKIMQGNSLLESYNGIDLSDLTKVNAQKGLWDSDNFERENLIEALRKYYKTADHTERDRLFNEIINNVRRQLLAKGITLPNGEDPSANSDFFLWHTWFSDVFKNGGFDIVIGNPPYIEFKNYPKEEKEKLIHYITAKGKYDIYIPFIEMGTNILKKDGILTYICPTRFLKRDYGRSLRAYIVDILSIETIIDFADFQIFDNAMTYTGVFIFKNKTQHEYSFRYSTNLNGVYQYIDSSKLRSDIWNFSCGIEETILSKIIEGGKVLNDISYGIIQGVATGKDSVYLIKEGIIKQYDIEREILKPFLKGKDISPYKINWSGYYVLYPYDSEGKVISESLFMQKYPNAYDYLVSKKKELKGRGYFEKSTKKWYELWNQRKPSKFEGIKIVTLDNASRNSFALDENNYYGTTTVYNIKIKDDIASALYVLGILNSKLLDFYHKSKTIPQANGFYRYQAIFIKDLPIVIAENFIQKEIEGCVRRIMSDDIEAQNAQKKLDITVYHLYNLTYDEILIVDPETPISREEYEIFKL